MSDAVRRIRLMNGITVINGITGETAPTYCEYVLATAYDALEAENVPLLAELDDASPFINCARCAKPDRMHRMCLEEGDEWECVECNDRCNAQEKAALAASNDKGDGT